MAFPNTIQQVSPTKLLDAFHDIITGKGVKRSKHELILDGKSVVELFIEKLQKLGYIPATVGEVNVQPGERVPAFLIKDSTAYFGWVFWEKFTIERLRKLWGSVIRNKKGDWAIQLPPTKPVTIYANQNLKLEMDIDYPSDF